MHSHAAASVESKMATMQHKIFCISLKLSQRLLCSVRFVFVSTFNLQYGRAFVIGITSSNFEIQTCETESIFLNHAVFLISYVTRNHTMERQRMNFFPFCTSPHKLWINFLHLQFPLTYSSSPLLPTQTSYEHFIASLPQAHN